MFEIFGFRFGGQVEKEDKLSTEWLERSNKHLRDELAQRTNQVERLKVEIDFLTIDVRLKMSERILRSCIEATPDAWLENEVSNKAVVDTAVELADMLFKRVGIEDDDVTTLTNESIRESQRTAM